MMPKQSYKQRKTKEGSRKHNSELIVLERRDAAVLVSLRYIKVIKQSHYNLDVTK